MNPLFAHILLLASFAQLECQVIRQEERLTQDDPQPVEVVGHVHSGRRLVSISPTGTASFEAELPDQPDDDDVLARYSVRTIGGAHRLSHSQIDDAGPDAELLDEHGFNASTLVGACYDSARRMLEGCACHSSCLTCGYRNNPVQDTDCVSCKNGAPVVPVYSNGVGKCTTPPRGGCYDGKHHLIQGCQCHSDCKSCGFGQWPNSSFNCIECTKAGFIIERVNSDGTGRCIPPTAHAEGKPSSQCQVAIAPDSPKVPGCYCHYSCASCRGPKIDQCFSCKSDQVVTVKYNDGAGLCFGATEEPTGCYDSKAMKINSCSCHPSCKACGYGASPTSESKCISCNSGFTLFQKWHDGTGYCQNMSKRDCYDKDKIRIDNCECHPSCHNCGYAANPTSADSCITCASGVPPTQVFNNGVGKCEKPAVPGCYNHKVMKIQSCSCHWTCKTCGYSEDPTGPYNCIECKYPDTHKLAAHWHDGTGTCVAKGSLDD